MTGRKNWRLLRHDWLIVANETRSALSAWSDRLLVLGLLLLALLAMRAGLSDRPYIVAAIAVFAISTMSGAAVARAIERRMIFHMQDGVLAGDALARAPRRRYALALHALFCAILIVCAALGRPGTVPLAPMGYLIGAGVWHIAARALSADPSPRRVSHLREINLFLQRPISGALAGVSLALPLIPGSMAPAEAAGVVGLMSAAAALLLTALDYQVVRFMTEAGYTSGRIIARHGRSAALFLVVGVSAPLALSQWLVAIVVAAVILAALALMTARILAYRVHSKRTADMLVSICAGLVGLTVIAMPMLVPLVVLAMLFHLHIRAGAATWLLK